MNIKDFQKEGFCNHCNKVKLVSFCFYFNPSGNYASEGKYLTCNICDDCKNILDDNKEENEKLINLLQQRNRREYD